MNNINTFDKIDNFLNEKKSSEVSVVFLMVFAIIAFISYAYIYPVTDTMLKRAIKNQKSIQAKLNQEQAYLRSVTRNGDEQFLVKQAASEVKAQKILLENSIASNAYVDNKLKELSYLLYNDENWAKFLDSITLGAKENSIKIQFIKNQFIEPNFQKIEQVLNINLAFNGAFSDVMKFINTIEESDLVVDVNKLDLKSSNVIEGNLDIAVWGMKY